MRTVTVSSKRGRTASRYLSKVARIAAVAISGLTAVTASAADAPNQAKGNAKTNVVLIVTDDLGYNDFGFQGSRDIVTPNLDRLANNGVKFTNAYVTAPICGASRAGLISGRYQQRHSYEANPRPTEGLAVTEATLADAFHSAGYATGAVGKWSIGQGLEFRPQKRGFDEFFGFLGMTHPYVPGNVDPALRMVGETPRPGFGVASDPARPNRPARDTNGQSPATRPNRGAGQGGFGEGGRGQQAIGASAGHFVRGDTEVEENSYATEAFSREAIGFIDRHKQQPFFLYLAFNASHSPLQPTEKYVRRFPQLSGKRQLYAATTSAMDDAVGEVLTKLRNEGLEENTVIAFINDNGGPINDIAANNFPLSGAKMSLWEGGIRVPFFLHWKGHLPERVTRDEPVISLDVFPTLLAATGVPTPKDKQLEGINLLPLTTGEKAADVAGRTLYWRYNNLWAVREGRWKLTVPQRGVESPLLFDLQADVGENTDVAGQHPDVVAHLTAEWNSWNAQNRPIPTNNGFGGGFGGGGPRNEPANAGENQPRPSAATQAVPVPAF